MTTPTPEQIEAGARALFEASQELDQDNSWDDQLPDEWREAWRNAARDTIEAAAAAAPLEQDTESRQRIEKYITQYDQALYTKEDTIARLASLAFAETAEVHDALVAAIADELETDDGIAEDWSAGKLQATARRLVVHAIIPTLSGDAL